jgi:hypothetical protein
MREIEIKHIDIVPTIFIKHEDDADVVLMLYPNGIIEKKRFTKNMLKGIDNPMYLLVGIITGVGVMQLNVVDANEFKEMFFENWMELLTNNGGDKDLTA